ncbi:MAG: PLP-dependent aminotransferase family protein [Fimbriimonas sp.]
MTFRVDREGPTPPGAQIVENLREGVRTGRLAPGHLLPPVRTLARELGVAPMTVVRAYARLREEGLLESRGGSGTRVATRPGSPAAAPMLAEVPRAGPLNLYEPLSEAAGTVSLASSVPDPGFAVLEEILPGMFDALRDSPWSAYYAPARGAAEYVNAIARLLRADGVSAVPEDVVATFGSTHARALVLRALTRPGESVTVEIPGRLDGIAGLAGLGARPIPVAREKGELDLDRLEYGFAREGARLLFVAPTFGSTTGEVMGEAHRARLVEMAARYGAFLVEDASYARLNLGSPAPAPLGAYDAERVITIDSFSYAVSPALRLGYVRAAGGLSARIASESQRTVQSGIVPLQTAMGHWLEGDGLTRHLRRVLPHYRARRDAMIQALRAWMPPGTRWSDPLGGFSLWLDLPPGDFGDLYDVALAAGVPFAPGRLFVPQNGDRHLRLSYGRHAPETLTNAVRTLASLVRGRTE